MDLARAPRRVARKKGSGYENVIGQQALWSPSPSAVNSFLKAREIFGAREIKKNKMALWLVESFICSFSQRKPKKDYDNTEKVAKQCKTIFDRYFLYILSLTISVYLFLLYKIFNINSLAALNSLLL
jgi:hypothetical protein